MNKTMSMVDQDYLRQQLEWVNTRMKALDRITLKLTEMKKIAEYAKENELTSVEAQDLNTKLKLLQLEVIDLDKKSRVFWMDCQ